MKNNGKERTEELSSHFKPKNSHFHSTIKEFNDSILSMEEGIK